MNNPSENLNNIVNVMPPEPLKGPLSKVRKKKLPPEPSSLDPRTELKRLTKMHKGWTRRAVAISNMSSDRINRETGMSIPCDLPMAVRAQMSDVVDSLQREAKALESQMMQQLKQIPIYQQWLGKQFSAKGPVVSSYLVSEIDIHKATKSSQLRRYCGLAVIDGRLERRSGAPKAIGGTGTFNDEIRMRLYQMFDAMWKNARHDPENKYLKVWKDARHRIEHSERILERDVDKDGVWTGKIINATGHKVSARGFAHSYGWHKAADVFIEDLYIVWRTLEGLEVWPSYYAAKLGYEHGGKISVNAPRKLTIEEALQMVAEPYEIVRAK